MLSDAHRREACWQAFLRGDPPRPALGEDLFGACPSQGTALESLAALGRGDQQGALKLARQASRQASAESDPASVLLANLTLARVRRHAGKPYLARRILDGLTALVTSPWEGWYCWELLIAGGNGTTVAADAAALAADHPLAHGAQLLSRLLGGIAEGDRAAFRSVADELLVALPVGVPFRDEAAQLVGLLDPEAPCGPEVQAWRSGEVWRAPSGLHGIGVVGNPGDGRADMVVGFVTATPGNPGRRLLRVGIPLLGPPGWDRSPVSVDDLDPATALDSTQLRPATGLAALALAGPPGISRSDFFRAVYGFPFASDVHKGVLDVLVHRMRKAAASLGDLVRAEEHMTLHLRRSVLIPDPRCVQPADERMLAHLVAAGPLSTEDAARMTGLPLRTVQSLIRQLVEEGSCRQVRQGRSIRYHVEDTTFRPVPPASLSPS